MSAEARTAPGFLQGVSLRERNENRSGILGKTKTGFSASFLGQESVSLRGDNWNKTILSRLEELDGSLLQHCTRIPNLAVDDEQLVPAGLPLDTDQRRTAQCALLEAVFSGRFNNGFAVIASEEKGTSLWRDTVTNDIRHLIDACSAKKVLVVDWHGNGPCDAFQNDERILYFSFDEGRTGKGTGGATISVPLVFSDADCFAILFQVLLPIAFEYNPEIVVVLFGDLDKNGVSNNDFICCTPAVYGYLTHFLLSFSGGKVVLLFEDSLQTQPVIAESAVCAVEALLGYPCQPLPPISAASSPVMAAVENVIASLASHWSCFKIRDDSTVLEKKKKRKSATKLHSTPTDQRQTRSASASKSAEKSAEDEAEVVPKRSTAVRGQELSALLSQYETFRASTCIKHRTCLVYDDLMLEHNREIEGDAGPEISDRLTSIFDHLSQTGLLKNCLMVEPRDVQLDELALIHTDSYVKSLNLEAEAFAVEVDRRKRARSGRWPDDIWATPSTQPAIFRAVGSLLNVVDAVLNGKALNGYAIIRPPGHHAHDDHPGGFCFANNVAIAAKFAMQKHDLRRILIVDWDVHHGDGTQASFYDDPRVCYISLHRGETEFYPGGKEKHSKWAGLGKGAGYNINIPWHQPGVKDGDYVAAFMRLIMPVAYEFSPEIILVSCGFDAALGDQLGGCCVTNVGYSVMTRMLLSLAGGKVVLALEGGYNLKMLAKCSGSVVRALLGFEADVIPQPLIPSLPAVRDITEAVNSQREVPQSPWTSIQRQAVLEDTDPMRSLEDSAATLSSLMEALQLKK